MPKKICITGGAGYIGSALAISLSGMNDVTSYDIVDECWGDIRFRLDFNEFDIVYHLAAIAGNVLCKQKKWDIWDTNIKGSFNVANRLREEQTLIFTSTTAIYGEPSLYSESKSMAEEKILSIKSNAIILRLPTIFGTSPHMREYILVNDLVKSAVKDGYIVLRSPDTKRPFLHIEECIRALKFVAENHEKFEGKIIDLGHPSYTASKREMAEIIVKHTGCELFISKQKDPYEQDFELAFDEFVEFGFEPDPMYSLNNGIKHLVEYYRGN
jgi:nucleoside-diphosphate-sugar epimerase